WRSRCLRFPVSEYTAVYSRDFPDKRSGGDRLLWICIISSYPYFITEKKGRKEELKANTGIRGYICVFALDFRKESVFILLLYMDLFQQEGGAVKVEE